MWDCIECGVRRIAASILRCPVCRKERDMATATTGGASNARAVLHETGYVPPEAPEVPVTPVPAEAAAEDAVADAAAPEEPAADDAVPEVAEPAEAVSEPHEPEPDAEPQEM